MRLFQLSFESWTLLVPPVTLPPQMATMCKNQASTITLRACKSPVSRSWISNVACPTSHSVVKTTAVPPALSGEPRSLSREISSDTQAFSQMQFALAVVPTLSLLTLSRASKFHDTVYLVYSSVSSGWHNILCITDIQ